MAFSSLRNGKKTSISLAVQSWDSSELSKTLDLWLRTPLRRTLPMAWGENARFSLALSS